MMASGIFIGKLVYPSRCLPAFILGKLSLMKRMLKSRGKGLTASISSAATHALWHSLQPLGNSCVMEDISPATSVTVEIRILKRRKEGRDSTGFYLQSQGFALCLPASTCLLSMRGTCSVSYGQPKVSAELQPDCIHKIP
jgi:hypothetical protein